MTRPDTFTITSFWINWLMLPLMLAAAVFTIRWALADRKQSTQQEGAKLQNGASFLPLMLAALGFVIAGLGLPIGEAYWGLRVILIGQVIWIACCLVGAALSLIICFHSDQCYRESSILTVIGLVLMAFALIFPGLLNPDNTVMMVFMARTWYVISGTAIVFLIAGILMGFPYRLPRFALVVGGIYHLGLGLAELTFSRTAFPWLIRLWRFGIDPAYLDAFPVSTFWQIEGAAKVIVGVAVLVIVGLVSLKKMPVTILRPAKAK